MQNRNFVPNASCNFGNNLEVNRGSWFETIDTRVSYWLTIWSTYNLVLLSNRRNCLIGMKRAILVNLSTTTWHSGNSKLKVHGYVFPFPFKNLQRTY